MKTSSMRKMGAAMNKAESNSTKTEKPKATLQKVQPLKAKLVVADPGCRPVGN